MTKTTRRVWPNKKVISTLKELRNTLYAHEEAHFKAFFRSSGDAAAQHYGKEQAYKFAISEITKLIERELNNGKPVDTRTQVC